MKIEVIFLLNERLEDYFFNRNVVVIDILRATSTIITALANGAKSIIPTATVEEAVKIAKNLERSTYLLCGERNTKTIDGFDLGNSPLEYTEDKVSGRKIIFTSTNGTKVFERVKFAKNILIGSTLNATACVSRMQLIDDDWILVCSGRDGCFDESDAVGAGLLIELLSQDINNLIMNDAARVSQLIFNRAKNNLKKYLKRTDHGQILMSNGFEGDIDFISQIDKFSINANFSNNIIGLLQ